MRRVKLAKRRHRELRRNFKDYRARMRASYLYGDLWSFWDRACAARERWRLRLPPKMRAQIIALGAWDDEEAEAYVYQKAAKGSEFHQRAVQVLTIAMLNGADKMGE